MTKSETQKYVQGLRNKIEQLETEIQRKETTIDQIDDILNELFGVTHDVVRKPDELKKILNEKIDSSKTIANFLPTEPIKIAYVIIDFGVDNYFNVSELRQIAEHLLVYCNANCGEE